MCLLSDCGVLERIYLETDAEYLRRACEAGGLIFGEDLDVRGIEKVDIKEPSNFFLAYCRIICSSGFSLNFTSESRVGLGNLSRHFHECVLTSSDGNIPDVRLEWRP